MAIISVPKPSRKSMDPGRDANCLLRAQVEHLHHAERRLPLRYRSSIYIRAIRTEGEAAQYIREVTEAIHKAHRDAADEREKRARTAKGLVKPRAKVKKSGRDK